MLSGGEVTLTLPVGSRESAYQVKIDTDMESCESEGAPEGPVAACVTVEILDIDGNPEEDVALDHAATLEFRLSPARVAELGGQSALSKASAEGRIKLLTRDGPGDSWTEVPFAIFLTDDGGALFVASSIMHFSEFALVIVPALPSVGRRQYSRLGVAASRPGGGTSSGRWDNDSEKAGAIDDARRVT